MNSESLKGRRVRMAQILLFSLQATVEDVERTMNAVVKVMPLSIGNCDSNVFPSAAGVERHWPLGGAAADPHTKVRRRSGVVEVSFELPYVRPRLGKIVEVIFQARSCQEPIIRLLAIFSNWSRGAHDSQTSNDWCNSTRDWKKGNLALVEDHK